jgi:hypothetical protein
LEKISLLIKPHLTKQGGTTSPYNIFLPSRQLRQSGRRFLLFFLPFIIKLSIQAASGSGGV